MTIPDTSSSSFLKKHVHFVHIFRFLVPYKLRLLGVFVALCVTSLSMLSLGKGMQYLVDKGLNEHNTLLLDKALIVLLGINVFLAIGTYMRYYLITSLGEKVIADIRKALYAHVIYLSPEFYETNKIGEILSKMTTDTTLLQVVVGETISIAMRNILLLSGGLIMLMITSPKLTFYIIILIPLIVGLIIFFGRKVRVLARKTQDEVAKLASYIEESLNRVKTIQSFAREAHEGLIFEKNLKDLFLVSMRRIRMRANFTAWVILTVFGSVTFILYVGGHDVLAGRITAGQLTSFIFYAVLVASAFGALGEVMGSLQHASGAAERIMELLSTPSPLVSPENPVSLPAVMKGHISFKNITFTYPSKTLPALKNFSLEIAPSEIIAIVGPSGSGKTTLTQLLLRFYDPQEGEIYIDNIPIKDIKLTELRALFGVVAQESIIFSANVYDNIAYGKPLASKKEIEDIAEKAACDFIEELPQRFDSFLGEKGIFLSGGQKQRISIARALLKEPTILLLDEATSALDSENEKKVQYSLEKLMHTSTTIIIAHRLSTIQHADRILVLHDGRIEEEGTHFSLMKNEHLYWRLVSGEVKN